MAPAWASLVLLAVLAWAVTVSQARDPGMGSGRILLQVPLFLALWVAMMAAMMFPSIAPVATLWAKLIRGRSSRWAWVGRMASFLTGYLVAWTAYGLVAFAELLGVRWLVEVAPGGAKWIGAGILAIAGLYQITPLKEACLRHCRSPMGALLHYASFRGISRDLRVGVHHGLYCVGCCWGLMAVLAAVGVMNVAAMAALAAVIFLEKLWRRGPLLSRVVGVTLLAIAVLAPFQPWLLPGLRASSMAGM